MVLWFWFGAFFDMRHLCCNILDASLAYFFKWAFGTLWLLGFADQGAQFHHGLIKIAGLFLWDGLLCQCPEMFACAVLIDGLGDG